MTGPLLLFITALIWGSAFVAQRLAAAHLGIFIFNSLRFLLAGLILLALAGFRLRLPQASRRDLLAICLALFAGSALQQAGLLWTTAGNAGFITSLYIVIIPAMLAVAGREVAPARVWSAAGLAVFGMLLLSTGGRLRLNPGDFLELGGAFGWALHVILLGRLARQVSLVHLAAAQYLGAGLLHLPLALLFESGRLLPGLQAAGWTIVYVGVVSTAIGYTLQAAGQRHTPATQAALILSLEAVFAALFEWAILGVTLSTIQIAGAGLILGAVLLAQSRPQSV